MSEMKLNQPLHIQQSPTKTLCSKKSIFCMLLICFAILSVISVVIWACLNQISINGWETQILDGYDYWSEQNQPCGAVINGNGYFWGNWVTLNNTYAVSSLNKTGIPSDPSTLSFNAQIIPDKSFNLPYAVPDKPSFPIKPILINNTIFCAIRHNFYSYNPVSNDAFSYRLTYNVPNAEPICMALNNNTNTIYIIVDEEYTNTTLFLFDVHFSTFIRNYTLQYVGGSGYGFSCIFDKNNTLYAFATHLNSSKISFLRFDDNNMLIGDNKFIQHDSFQLKYPVVGSYAITFDHNIIDIIGVRLLPPNNHFSSQNLQFVSQTLDLKQSKVLNSSFRKWDFNRPIGYGSFYLSGVLVDYEYNKTYLLSWGRIDDQYPNLVEVYYWNENKETRWHKWWNKL
eukprot:285822_1